ncbi:uncharacterized protein LOC110838912 isoform X2 [Zootermopsis nevadensis]|uniref:Death domain-containing protein n=2 Tax=Zootermopsis nevadensis TaxID=136037 RepID=A0A067QJN3_ZOONE|nr:uncharacterized protein LOC110838912 isoform X2 [Zootermopsis nevadensis]KDR09189.1 hypothetical protein L798_01116 [Zootermopsis nevadensis]
MANWSLRTSEHHAARRSWRRVTEAFQKPAQSTKAVALEQDFKRLRTGSSGEDADIMQSKRRLTERDICIVASQLGASWRILGLRLNFSPETLDDIAKATAIRFTDKSFEQMAQNMLRLWSKLPTATVGRLVILLWEMGHHAIALQLQP